MLINNCCSFSMVTMAYIIVLCYRQGKLKRDKSKQIKEKKELEGRRGNEKQFRPKKDLAQEDEIEVEEEDIQFFKSHQQRSSFVSNVDNRYLPVDFCQLLIELTNHMFLFQYS